MKALSFIHSELDMTLSASGNVIGNVITDRRIASRIANLFARDGGAHPALLA